jgi:GTPase SAR1 family protein
MYSVQSFFNDHKVKSTFSIGHSIITAFQPVLEKPTYWSVAKVAFNVGEILLQNFEIWPEAYFYEGNWSEPFGNEFSSTIMSVIGHYPFSDIKTMEEGTFIRTIVLDGMKVSWLYCSSTKTPPRIWVENENIDRFKEEIKDLLWAKHKDKPLVMRINDRTQQDEARIIFDIDDAFFPLPSEKASSCSSYLKRCIDANVHRSIMLYGPPGTGKSTLARAIVENLKLRSFRIRIEDMAFISNAMLSQAIALFQPEAIILDDFDRANNQASLLETLEFFQRHVTLVIATVNDRDKLDDALLRPGRFDELIFVECMDESVVKFVLGDFVDGYNFVKNWPIAFIHEYVKRRTFMSSEEAQKSMTELANRVKKMSIQNSKIETWDLLDDEKPIENNDHNNELLDE